MYSSQSTTSRASGCATVTVGGGGAGFFFGLHHLTLALVDILVINALILATIFAFARVNKTASLMMVPYWLWVSFAAYLTWAIRALNT